MSKDRWIENDKGCIVCPECYTFFNNDDRREFMHYCPYCGAVMSSEYSYLLIVGSRSIPCSAKQVTQVYETISKYVKSNTFIVSGAARGVDSLAAIYAKDHNLPLKEFLANWDKFGNAAGFKRNEEMHKFIAQFPNRQVLAFWDGVSKGTAQNFDLAVKYNNPIEIIEMKLVNFTGDENQ